MADRVLLIGWGAPARGREKRGLEVVNEAMGLYGRMQQPLRSLLPIASGRSRPGANVS